MFNWLFTIFLFIVSFQISAQEIVLDYGEKGKINWTTQAIETIGVGRLNPNLSETTQKTTAIEDAKKMALQNILKTVENVAITSETSVRDLLMNDPLFADKLEGVSRNFVVRDIRYVSNGEVEIDVSFPLYGALSDLLLHQDFGGGELNKISQPLCPCCGQPWPENKPVPEGVELIMPKVDPEFDISQKYTGVIIQVSGYQLKPSLIPRICRRRPT